MNTKIKAKAQNLVSVTLLAIFALPTLPVQAQSSAEATLEEITVTARKINESIQDAPITVNVLTADDIADAGITQTADYIQLIPNVSLADSQTAGDSFLTVRGLSRVRNGEMPVAVVVDGVSIVNARQFATQIFDVEQIEVVKGPQGAYYGRNAANGAIIITTRPPADEAEGYVKFSYGTADEMALEGSFSAPINDELGWRLSAHLHDRDGYFTNVTLDEDVDPLTDKTLRSRLLWQPDDSLALDFKAEVAQTKGKGIAFHWPGAATFEQFGFYVGTAAALGVTPAQVSAEGANLTGLPYVANNPDRGERDVLGLSLRIDKSFALMNVLSVSTYDELTLSAVADRAPYLSTLDGTQHNYVDVKGFSQELRLSSNWARPWNWQLGAYYLDWERQRTVATGIDKGFGIKRPTTVPEFQNSSNPTGLAPGNFGASLEDNRAWALFASVNWDLSEQLTLSVAGRYDRERRVQNVNPYNTAGRVYMRADADGENQPYAGAACQGEAGELANVNCGAYTTYADLLANTRLSRDQNKKTFSKFQPKIALSYQPFKNLNIFGNWGIGYRAGQFNYPGVGSISKTAQDVIDQEENTVFEIGFKGQYENLRFSAAYFNSSVDNTQYFPFDGAAFVQVFEDIDKAELDGFELEASWLIMEELNVYAAYGKTNSEITAYAERPATVGNELPYVPDNTLNLGGRYGYALGEGLEAFFRVDYEQRGKQFWTPDNTYPRKALNLLNIRFGVEGEAWSSALYINNVTDKKYNSEVVTPLFLHPAAPRIWRWELRYNF